jgi:hypothetical protein
VTDALGQTWRTSDIYETSVLTTIYGMVFITVLAALSLARRSAAAPASTTDAPATPAQRARQPTPRPDAMPADAIDAPLRTSRQVTCGTRGKSDATVVYQPALERHFRDLF